MKHVLGLFTAFCLLVCAANTPTRAQPNTPPVAVKKVADDLYFFFDYAGSNSVFLVTNDGVLVIDTRQHPRAGQELIDEIRKVTDKPIRFVINSHFHGDHTFGNAAFQRAGAVFIAQQETPKIMQRVQAKEMARRQAYFKSHNYDPNEVKLILSQITFDKSMTLWLGGREVRLMYLGPGQQDGDTFVYFPHAHALFTPGSFATRSIPNFAFTTSVDSWINLLDGVAGMKDVNVILPAHGDLATQADVKEFSAMLRDIYTTVKADAGKGVSLPDAQRRLTFPQYRNWRNYGRIKDEIASLYELIKTGKRSYFE
ncbi:MAG TPA: MBL fold metallo-hydrolase [Micropepsaceae bacterium]|nr:MBL fold metallo-hydrolase [Micropepsaceae bacterium]